MEGLPPRLREFGKKYAREHVIAWLMGLDFTRKEAEKIYDKLFVFIEPIMALRWARRYRERFMKKVVG